MHSGEGMEVELHGYGGGTHNLSRTVRTSMMPGTLVPVYCNQMQPGDKWDIRFHAGVRTQPTIGPLYGSFELAIDVFKARMSLYNKLMHNNRTSLARNMATAYIPQIVLSGPNIANTSFNRFTMGAPNNAQISNSALIAYLGVRGLGHAAEENVGDLTVQGEFNAIPVLMYYETVKNYYWNKQEQMAPVLSSELVEAPGLLLDYAAVSTPDTPNDMIDWKAANGTNAFSFPGWWGRIHLNRGTGLRPTITSDAVDSPVQMRVAPYATPTDFTEYKMDYVEGVFYKPSDPFGNSLDGAESPNYYPVQVGRKIGYAIGPEVSVMWASQGGDPVTIHVQTFFEYYGTNVGGGREVVILQSTKYSRDAASLINIPELSLSDRNSLGQIIIQASASNTLEGVDPGGVGYYEVVGTSSTNAIVRTTKEWFDIENIELMRDRILSQSASAPLVLTQAANTNQYMSMLPYSTINTPMSAYGPGIFNTPLPGMTSSVGRAAGLALKTYKSDRFNTWLNTDFVESLSEAVNVSAANGVVNINELNSAEKLYNLEARIAATEQTYTGWIQGTYGLTPDIEAEMPVFCGGATSSVVFDEVVSTAAATGEPLGTLAGRGNMEPLNGEVHVQTDEPAMVMAIASITPIIAYTEGNRWFTRLKTFDDLHKPEFDGIGYQAVLLDEVAAWSTERDSNGIPSYKSMGKQVAWAEYMTDVDENYGDFADVGGLEYLVLNRTYESAGQSAGATQFEVQDATSYIDPTKYNYAFASTTLDAQNFWLHVKFDIKAYRKVGNKEIPHV